MNPKTAALLVQHVHNHNANQMNSIHDSKVWRHSKDELGLNPRDLRFGLCIDPVNPYSLRSSTYSVCPVFLVNYNLPPTLNTKKAFLTLALIIPGKHQPTNMKVYLKPLMEELNKLWTVGVRVWDAAAKEYFIIRTIVVWTITNSLGLQLYSG
jgi:hypothetical protein